MPVFFGCQTDMMVLNPSDVMLASQASFVILNAVFFFFVIYHVSGIRYQPKANDSL